MATIQSIVEAQPGFRPYTAHDSGATIHDVQTQCNRAMFSGYGPPTRQHPDRPVAYPIAAYRQLIASLAQMSHVECVTLADLCAEPGSSDKVRLAIRHDVDGDIVAAEKSADIEAEFGVPTSYYLLHTAFYYGRFDRSSFARHNCMAHIYRRMEALGHEIGLHTNGLEVYEEFGLDGAQAVATEIEWLRSIGLTIRGTVGHGSKDAFGAENFEIFKGRAKGRAWSAESLQEPNQISHNGKPAWVRVLNENDLELTYEGNDIFWQKQIRVEYGATRTVDGWRWNQRFDRQARGQLAFCTQEALLADIARLKPGCCVVLTIHPCYYGFRHRPDAPPCYRLERKDRIVHPDLGWHTWAPRSIVACHADEQSPENTRQSIAMTNALGMLDRESGARSSSRLPTRRVLLLGGAGFADPAINPASHPAQIIEASCQNDERSITARVLAHPHMGCARLYGWLEWALANDRPTDIILGLGALERAWSMPQIWRSFTGLSHAHPAGVCLLPDREGNAIRHDPSPGWMVRQQKPRELETWPGTTTPIAECIAPRRLPRIDGIDCDTFITSCIEQFAAAASKASARLLIALTDDGPIWTNRSLAGAYRERVASWVNGLPIEVIDPIDDIASLERDGISILKPGGGLSVDALRAVAHACAARLNA